MTQKQLGDAIGMAQTWVSKLENPEYGKMTVATLLRLATSAFDTDLEIKFRPFSETLHTLPTQGPEYFSVPSFEEEKDDIQSKLHHQEEMQLASAANTSAQSYSLATGLSAPIDPAIAAMFNAAVSHGLARVKEIAAETNSYGLTTVPDWAVRGWPPPNATGMLAVLNQFATLAQQESAGGASPPATSIGTVPPERQVPGIEIGSVTARGQLGFKVIPIDIKRKRVT